jgi:hypothetical protein
MTNEKPPSRSAKALYDVSKSIWSMRLRILELENTLNDVVDVLDKYSGMDIMRDGLLVPIEEMCMQTEIKRVLALKEDW